MNTIIKKVAPILALAALLPFATNCGNSNTTQTKETQKVVYKDINNKHRKSHVPVLINWEHDLKVQSGQSINVRVVVSALQGFTDAGLHLKLGPQLKLISGETEISAADLAANETLVLELEVEPTQTGAYEIGVHFSGKYQGRQMGTARGIQMVAGDYRKLTPKQKPSYKSVNGTPGYTELPGRTEKP